MALLTKEQREKRFKYLGLGEYNKANIKKLQNRYLRDKDVDGIYGKDTDNLLRHLYNVKKCAPSFKPTEFKCECGGRYCTGYPSYMKQVELKHLQTIRNHYGKPMVVTSGLRCSGWNSRCGGSIQNSLHLVGRACDFYMQGVTDTLANRKKAIKYIKTLPHHHYTYGNGINSVGSGVSVYAPYMGNAMHTDVNKAPVTSKKKKVVKKVSPYYSKTTTIGEAAGNERGGLQGGSAGDQAKEVRTRSWYSGGWIYMFRAKDKAVREALAQAMIDTCGNKHIGYDTKQPDRYTAWDLAEKNGHKIKKISKNCETTCSQAVSMCMRAAGIPKKYAPRHCDIAVMRKVMPKSPYFTMYKSKKYTQTTANLLPGDILLSSHHTVIVVKSPNAK